MVKWRLLPFIRLAGKGNKTQHSADDDGASVGHNNNTTTNIIDNDDQYSIIHQRSHNMIEQSMFGCKDEIFGCSNNLDGGGLFANNLKTCRWPSAELCLSTCGQCPLVQAAKSCQSLEGEIDNRLLLKEQIDWSSFFENITSQDNTDRYPYLKDAKILNKETPWVAEFPNYLNSDEVDEILRVANLEGYRVEDEHPKHIRDVNVTNCDSIQCMRQPIISELYDRASSLISIHPNNFESIEFIDYSIGQHYKWHADEYSWKDPVKDPISVIAGPRILTMFHYLSDVEEGGETAFAGIDPTGQTPRLKVVPKKGKMIIWANMKNDWRYSENSAVHSALPVRRGRKFAGTIWVHSSGFRIPELYSAPDCNPRYFYYYQQQQQQQQQQQKQHG